MSNCSKRKGRSCAGIFRNGDTICDICDRSYQQGRANAIDEFVAYMNTMPTYTNENGVLMPMPIEMMADRIKNKS